MEHFRARWADMDFNQHMRNAAYLGCAEDTRMRWLDRSGFPMTRFRALGIGPVVLEDRLTYKRELGLLEPFAVDILLAAATDDFRKVKVRNPFFLDDGTPCAVVESFLLWFDLGTRRPVVPPDDLQAVWRALPRTEDFTGL
jgi:acyl-CoA thioester hydrolase